MCAYNMRGRRVAYDNIAVGSATGVERTLPNSTSDLAAVTDPSLHSPDEVSGSGNSLELPRYNNIAVGEQPGIEDTDNATADKLTSDGETVEN